MKSSWKTLLVGWAGAVYVIVSSLPDFTGMSWRQIAAVLGKAGFLAALGTLAKDYDATGPAK